MPKEIVGDDLGAEFIIMWDRDKSAHVAIDIHKGFIFVEDLEAAEDGATEEEKVIPEVHTSLWFEIRSWDDYNRLIRSLRRARDAKFGRPE